MVTQHKRSFRYILWALHQAKSSIYHYILHFSCVRMYIKRPNSHIIRLCLITSAGVELQGTLDSARRPVRQLGCNARTSDKVFDPATTCRYSECGTGNLFAKRQNCSTSLIITAIGDQTLASVSTHSFTQLSLGLFELRYVEMNTAGVCDCGSGQGWRIAVLPGAISA